MRQTSPEGEIMSLSASPFNLKFLLDENVKKRAGVFLRSRGFDTLDAPKKLANGKLAALSKSEGRVFVTNDADFADFILYSREKLFSVIFLKIPQSKPDSFIDSFSKLLDKKKSAKDFEGQLITLKEDGFWISPIPSSERIKSKNSEIFVYFTKS